MPHDYQGKAQRKFALPDYPQESEFDDPIKYEEAVAHFSMDCTRVFEM